MMECYENKTPTYLDGLDNNQFPLVDSYDYLQYPSSPFLSSMASLDSNSPSIGFNALNLTTGMSDFVPARPYTPAEAGSVSPPMLSYHLSAGELSSDSRGSGTHSPPHGIPYAATVPRSHRFNPIGSPPATRSSARSLLQRRKSTTNSTTTTKSASQDDSDEDDDDFQLSSKAAAGSEPRRETIRKQRIESEQRRRDELRDGYARLKDTLPPSNQKASKVSLLDRAVTHIRDLEARKAHFQSKLEASEAEVTRLRRLNEQLSLRAAGAGQRFTVAPSSTQF